CCLSLYRCVPLPALHSFPTRRSSDLFVLVLQLRQSLRHALRMPLTIHVIERKVKVGVEPTRRKTRLIRLTGPPLNPLDHRLDVVDRKSTRLNSSHVKISYAVFCLKKK